MNKLKIFIDFEAISAPFSYKLKIPNDLPFAYSIGIHKGKKFKTKTTIINFNHTNVSDIYEIIRKDIIKKIKILNGNDNFQVNKNTIEFIGWAPNLEKKILSKVFKGVDILDQAKGDSLSLSKLTEKDLNGKNYFSETKKEIERSIKPDFIKKRGLHFDGAIAALAGYELYRSAHNINPHYPINIDKKTLIKEISEYSKDDVVRMSILFKNPEIFQERKKALVLINSRKQVISKKINKLRKIITFLTSLDPENSIGATIENLKNEMNHLSKEKDNLKNL